MKVLNEKEATMIKEVGSKRINSNPITAAVRLLKVGQSLRFSREEWKPHTYPGTLISATFRGAKKFRMITLQDGWVLTRIK